jgi:hypothetical protein
VDLTHKRVRSMRWCVVFREECDRQNWEDKEPRTMVEWHVGEGD